MTPLDREFGWTVKFVASLFGYAGGTWGLHSRHNWIRNRRRTVFFPKVASPGSCWLGASARESQIPAHSPRYRDEAIEPFLLTLRHLVRARSPSISSLIQQHLGVSSGVSAVLSCVSLREGRSDPWVKLQLPKAVSIRRIRINDLTDFLGRGLGHCVIRYRTSFRRFNGGIAFGIRLHRRRGLRDR